LVGGTPLVLRSVVGANVQGAVPLAVENPLLLAGRVATGGDAVAWVRFLSGLTATSGDLAGAPPRTAPLVERAEIVPLGTVLAITIGAIDVERPQDDFLQELASLGPFAQRLDLLVGATASGLELAVAVQERDRTGPVGEELPPRQSAVGAEYPVTATELRRDVVVLSDRPVHGGAPVAVLLPSPLDAGAATAVLVVIEVLSNAPEPAALAAASARVARADAWHRAVAEAPDERVLAQRNALHAIATGEGRRTALLVLADAAGAPLAAELALTLEDEGLAAYARRIEVARVAPGPDLGWRIEREALRHVAALFAEDRAPESLVAVLLRYAGHAGRFPALLEDVAATSRDQTAAFERFVAENLLYLEDSDPAARLRALRWLQHHGRAPEAFDALAPRGERKAALRLAAEAQGVNGPAGGARDTVRTQGEERCA
jgi:hypothetical protein